MPECAPYGAGVAFLTPSDQPSDTHAVWVIYTHPDYYPHGYVLRPQYAGRNGQVLISDEWVGAPTVAAARQLLPPGLHKLPRDPRDDPSIHEVWI